jgi:hypothetical protein
MNILKTMTAVLAIASVQVYAAGVIGADDAGIIARASAELRKIAKHFQQNAGDVNKAYNDLNSQDTKPDTTSVVDTLSRIQSDNGRFTCVEDGVIKVDLDPANLGKSADEIFVNAKGERLLGEFVSKLEKSSDEVVTATHQLSTSSKDPSDNSKTINEERVYVVFGRAALLGPKLSKKTHKKFMCFVSKPLR